MTPEQIEQATVLYLHTRFPAGSPHKSFAANMASLVKHNPDKELTAGQAWYLPWLIYKYRRQLRGLIEIPDAPPERPCQPQKVVVHKPKVTEAAKPESVQASEPPALSLFENGLREKRI